MYVSPSADAFTAGSLASATLCAPSPEAIAPMGQDFTNAASQCAQTAWVVTRKSGWKRMIDVVLSPISGPTFCPQRGARPV